MLRQYFVDPTYLLNYLTATCASPSDHTISRFPSTYRYMVSCFPGGPCIVLTMHCPPITAFAMQCAFSQPPKALFHIHVHIAIALSSNKVTELVGTFRSCNRWPAGHNQMLLADWRFMLTSHIALHIDWLSAARFHPKRALAVLRACVVGRGARPCSFTASIPVRASGTASHGVTRSKHWLCRAGVPVGAPLGVCKSGNAERECVGPLRRAARPVLL